jgi:hypothetical protein
MHDDDFLSEEEMQFGDKVAAGIGIALASFMAIYLIIHIILNIVRS